MTGTQDPSLAALGARVAELERALTELADREAIRALIVDYATNLDARELRQYAELFASDGTWTGGLGHAAGPDGIVAMLEHGLVKLDLPAGGTYHLTFNPVVRVDGDRATATSRYAYLTRDDSDRPVISLVGHYEDELVRTPDGWRFQRREAFTDIPWKRRSPEHATPADSI